MKISPKIKAQKPVSSFAEENQNSDIKDLGHKHDDSVFQFNMDHMSFESTSGETFFCEVLRRGEPGSFAAMSSEEEEEEEEA